MANLKRPQGRPARITLSDEERIRTFLQAGMNNSEIAAVLRVPISTVRPYTRRIEAELAAEEAQDA